MRKSFKLLLGLLLAVLMVASVMTVGVFAEDTDVAMIDGESYASLAEALAAAKDQKDIVIDLLADATLDITAWQTLAIGGDTTETITINGNDKTLTFNKLNGDWNHVATNNGATLILKDMTITDSGKNNGPWNRYDLNFACDVQLNNVTSTKALAFKADAALKNVTINETGDNYAIWIQANGQTVTIDGLNVTSAGRGIKIDEQYVGTPDKVTLSVANATFTTAKKAAILVKSAKGADIALNNVDIAGVAADTVNAVWVDADAAQYFGLVTVTGDTKAQEDLADFTASLSVNGKIVGYYKTLQAAIDACVAGDNTITLLTDSSEDVTVKQTKDVNVTIDGAGKTYSGTITIHGNARYEGTETLTIQNVKFVTNEAKHYFIDSNSTGSVERYAHNVTVFNCYFLAEGAAIDSAAGVRIRQGFNINLTRNESYELHSLFQGYGCTGFTSAGNRIMSGKNGISVSTSTGVKISDTTIYVDGYGIRADGTGAYDMTVEVCEISAEMPVVIRKATGAYKLTMVGESMLGVTKEGGYQITFTNGDDGTFVEPTGEYKLNTNYYFRVYPDSAYVASIGEEKFFSLADAIAAAKAGDTITFLANITEDVTVSKDVTIDGADFTFTGKMVLSSQNGTVTIKNVNFDGKGYNGYAVETRGVYYVTIEDCTAKKYYGFVQLASATVLTTVKNVTVTNVNYGVKVDYSNAVVLENVDITAAVAAVLNSNYGEKTITIKDSKLSILGTWTRNNTIKTTYVFEGANAIDEFITDAAIDSFKLANVNSTLTAPEGQTVTTDVAGYSVKYEGDTYKVVKAAVAAIGSVKYESLHAAVDAAKPGATITLLGNASGAGVVINKNLTIDFRNFTYTFNEGVGSTGTESNGIQILKGTTVILRNGTLKVADEAADKFYILIQNYSDKLTLNNLVLDGRNLDKWSLTDGDSYVLSNNSGKVTVNSQTKFIVNDDGDKAFAFDVCDKSAWGYALPTITLNAAKAIYVDETTLATNYKQYIEATAVISNTYYATLQQAVNMGGTVNLFRDIEGPGVVINKDVNINFGNFTYTLTVPVGSTGTASNGFQILTGNTVVMRNGTLKVADEAAGKFYILIQNYANLTVNNMTLDGTNLDKWSLTDGDSYTLSNNSGNVTIGVGTKIIANNDGALAFAFDACDKTAWGYELPVVTVHKDAVIEGNIEAAAKIGNKYYATLQQAIDAAADKQTVTLLNDITVGKNDANILDGSYYTFFKVEGKSVTIDLNGHNIFADAAGMDKLLVGVFSTDNGGHLTLNDTAGGAVVEAVANGAKVYSLIANYESGCSITINGGTYKLDKASDSLIYSGASVGENEGIVVNGGTFVLDNVDTGVNGKPWIFNVLGSNNRHVDVHGGTFNFNIAYQNWAHEVNIVDDKGNLSYVIDNGDGTWTVSGKTAEVGIVSNTYSTKGFLVGYATFKDAVASIKKGQAETTIKLQKNITVKGQFIGHSYAQKVVIDLNGYTMSSADKTLTVYRSGTTVLIKNGTVSGNTSGGTIQVTYGGQLTLENVTVKSAGGSGNAIKVDANSTLIIADENVKVLGGARVNDILAANGAIIKISAGFFAHPVKDEWCAEGYFPITVDGGYSVATGACLIGNTVYGSLADAIEAAKDGDIIVMKNDITVSYADALDAADGFKSLFVISGKTITIDLNGKKILGDATGAPELVGGKYPEGMLLGMFTTLANGHLTLVDSSEGEGTVELASNGCLVYGLIVNYDKDCSITINEGNYIADDVFDALVYTSCDEGVVVNDGYFYLANVGQGTRGNGSPWIFNALGQNINSVVVNGGTFNANINAQHWVFEVKVDKTLALKDNGDGTWTVVEAAAYVNNQHWASGWYTRETGYATFQEAIDACEGAKTMTIGKKDYTSEKEIVTLLGDIDLDGPIIIG